MESGDGGVYDMLYIYVEYGETSFPVSQEGEWNLEK